MRDKVLLFSVFSLGCLTIVAVLLLASLFWPRGYDYIYIYRR
jgi:hypothetical protein